MEGFYQVDIFATKGIEYIAVIIFLIGLIYYWRWLNKPAPSAKPVENSVSLVDWFRMADNYYYHQGHSWVRPDEESHVRVGIDDFAQKLLGRADDIHVPGVGGQLEQGKEGIRIKIKDKIFQVLSPVTGTVVSVNKNILKNPELLNQDPYESGWLLKVHSPHLKYNLKNLLFGNIARDWFRSTVDALSRQISRNYGVVLQDGGMIKSGFVRDLPAEQWDQIARYFLLNDESSAV